jgi:hypothetical protein
MKVLRVMLMFAAVTLPGCTLFGIRGGTEEPRYATVAHVGRVEIRDYAPRLAAETTIDGTEMHARYAGFRRLANYIFGANRAAAKIAMTAPVAQAADSRRIAMTAPVAQTADGPGRWTIRFFMPAGYTRSTLPEPTDPAVHIVAVPAQTFAVLRFSGIPTARAVADEQAQLLKALADSAWQPRGTPVAWFYDPPWTIPFLRRNEVAVEAARR